MNYCIMLISLFLINVSLVAQVEKMTFRGWQNCYRIWNSVAEVVVDTETGGRVLSYKLHKGPDVIYSNPKLNGKLLADYQNEKFDPDGGRFDYTPESVTRQIHDQTWFGNYNISAITDSSITIISKPDTALGLITTRTFALWPGTSKLSVRQSWENISRDTVEYAYWSRTLVNAGGRLIVPLKSQGRTLTGGWGRYEWSEPKNKFGTDTSDSGIEILNDLLVFNTSLATNEKYGADAREGLMVYSFGSLFFVKKYHIYPHLKYVEEDFGLACIFYLRKNQF
ncbi:MAG: hypothetical protein HC896_14820 [Bacteroidales bacterium]|nr:hypothetical protein [Bacteroidales bacterium]